MWHIRYAGFALTAVWVSNAIPRPPAKRAAAIGIVNGFGNIGNLIGSFTWKAEWGPDYHPSMWISLGALLLTSALGLGECHKCKRDRKVPADSGSD